jgi:hypothetical protein
MRSWQDRALIWRKQRLASSQKQEEAEAHYERGHAQRDCDQCPVSLVFQVVLHRLAGMAPALGGQAGAVGVSSILNTNAFLGVEMRTQNSRPRKWFQYQGPQ